MPFERTKHQLMLADWPAKKNGNTGQAFRWRFAHQVRDIFIERPINDHPESTVVGIVRRKKKDRPPEIWIEHARMCDQQRSGKTPWFFAIDLPHTKLERAARSCASLRISEHRKHRQSDRASASGLGEI